MHPVNQTGSRASAPAPHSVSQANVVKQSRLNRSERLMHSLFIAGVYYFEMLSNEFSPQLNSNSV